MARPILAKVRATGTGISGLRRGRSLSGQSRRDERGRASDHAGHFSPARFIGGRGLRRQDPRMLRGYARAMTSRMTIAVSVLTVGLAIAALAGIPVLFENRLIGNIVTIVGGAVAIAGAVLLLLAIPAQRSENRKMQVNADIDVDQLCVERQRLWARKTDALARLGDALRHLDAARVAGQTNRATMAQADVARLQTENGDLDAALETNANEFRRLGVDPPEPAL